MTGADLVSAIVTAYNSERFLGEAIGCVLAQSYSTQEVFVIDDGSTDATESIIRSFGARIRLVRLENVGPPAARNQAVIEASGDLLAFLDADDLWHPEKISRQVAALADRPDLGYCVTHAQLFWSDELSHEADTFRDHPRAKPVPGFAASTWLVRRSTFEHVGPLREDLFFGDVVEWFARADRLGVPGVVLPDVLVSRRMHPANLTRRRRRDGRDYLVEFLKTAIDRRRATPDRHSEIGR